MDDSAVQTALCVIGHPIAGNPSQFCTLRALAALGLEWQCLSFDVPPESLPAALGGIDVLRFAGALIASPHHTALASLLAPPTTDPALPCPAPPCPAPPVGTSHPAALPWPDWIDGLYRGANDELVGCNFLGEAFGQLLQRHEQQIGQPLRHCVYLGDADSFQSLLVPFHQHLPASCFILGPSGLLPWPPPSEDILPSDDTRPSDALAASSLTSQQSPPGSEPAEDEPAATAASDPLPQAHRSEQNPLTAEAVQADDPQADQAEDPLRQPVLLIRPQPDHRIVAKTKPDPLREGAGESLLEQLHPDSLQIDLAPSGASWQVLRGRSDSLSAVVSPLDLEIGRIAAAIRRWTGCEPDRDILAEAIEEYLEI